MSLKAKSPLAGTQVSKKDYEAMGLWLWAKDAIRIFSGVKDNVCRQCDRVTARKFVMFV